MKYIHWSVVRLKFGIFHFNSAFLNWPLSFGVRSVTHEVDALLFLNEILLKQKIKTSANGVNTHTMCRLIFFFFFLSTVMCFEFQKNKKKNKNYISFPSIKSVANENVHLQYASVVSVF